MNAPDPNGRFDIWQGALAGYQVLTRRPRADDRGFFERLFCDQDLAGVLGGKTVVQINRSVTTEAGTVRGIHFQRPPAAEVKFVSCLRGRVFDVAVDLRRGSKTFLQWHGEVLSEGEFKTTVIPEGFGHGFQALEDICELVYFHTAAYAPALMGTFSPLDPALAITWPMPVTRLSDRDAAAPPVADFPGIAL